ncbi:unnamed protein product [Durusdinium trenchii]|uniref:Uncharacterized protein n=1 Tax=Durusdinium trenchii TaxID=1381693 RepID=A0ABP0LBR9_9DINO
MIPSWAASAAGYGTSPKISVELTNNEGDPPAKQPPNFRAALPLFDYQLRSLGWMLAREKAGGIRGGILADGIGYGKTTITLALMDHLRCADLVDLPKPPRQLLPSRATLIMMPPNLWQQWQDEIQKFLPPKAFHVLAAADGGQLRRIPVQQLQTADVVIVPYPIFRGRSYAALKWRLKHFHWHRIIADEFHELIGAAVDGQHPFNEAKHQLTELEATTRWGLTSTPPFRTIAEVAVTASFFQQKIQRCEEACWRFIEEMVRQNKNTMELPDVVQHKVEVLQSRHERALYLQQERDSNAPSILWDCASLHFDQSTSPKRQLKSAEQLCLEMLRKDREETHHLDEKLFQHCLAIEAKCRLYRQLVECLVMAAHDAPHREDPQAQRRLFRQLGPGHHSLHDLSFLERVNARGDTMSVSAGSDAQRAALATWVKCIDEAAKEKKISLPPKGSGDLQKDIETEYSEELKCLKLLESHLTRALLFERSLEDVAESFACPICFDDVPVKECGIAPCAHKACMNCWNACLNQDWRCPMCRSEVLKSRVVSVEVPKAFLQNMPDTRSVVQKLGQHHNRIAASKYSIYGSKLQCVVETILGIWDCEPDAKILVFCQSEELRWRADDAFVSLGLEHVTLKGDALQRATAIRRFSDKVNVMLLSMEISPSGLNLTVAHHVILAQPTCRMADQPEESVDFEEQAIGRCWRQGQRSIVHVWRLCMLGTVEEEMVHQHMALWTDRQIRSGKRPQAVNHSAQ